MDVQADQSLQQADVMSFLYEMALAVKMSNLKENYGSHQVRLTSQL